MSGTATAWPGQEMVAQPQWPGQEVTQGAAGRGEHGYAPAPPETPAPSPWETTTAREGSPEELPPTLTLPTFWNTSRHVSGTRHR